jgi:hypothetical protein
LSKETAAVAFALIGLIAAMLHPRGELPKPSARVGWTSERNRATIGTW